MRLLFAAGDVGGARALIPIIRLAEQQGIAALVLRHGHLAVEGPATWNWIDTPALDSARPDVLIFASSVKDTTALTLARDAQARGIPTIHVIDSWTMYRDRVANDGKPPLIPSIYAVVDDLAADGAAAEGIPRAVLRVTGQPALDLTGEHLATPAADNSNGKIKLLFISEPAAADHGTSAASRLFRGYTEATVLPLFCRALQPVADTFDVSLLPHPRENADDVAALWEAHKGKLHGTVLPQNSLAGGLGRFDGVAGMASLLLYQAWLVGRPVISIQPDLRVESLRQLEKREGVVFVDRDTNAAAQISGWAKAITPGQPLRPRPELALHARSAEHILELAKELTTKAM